MQTRNFAFLLLALLSASASAQTWLNSPVSRIQPGDAANASSALPQVNLDGRYVAFNSGANNVVTGQIDSLETDVFLLDRQTNTTTLVSHAAGEPLRSSAPGFSTVKGIAGQGSVLFDSTAPFLVAGQNAGFVANVFLHFPSTGNNLLLSHAAGSTLRSNGECRGRSIDSNGAAIVMACTSTDLQAGVTDTNGLHDLYFSKPGFGTNTLITHVAGNPTTAANGGVDAFNGRAIVADDQRYVAFTSRSTDLVANGTDVNNAEDVFVWDAQDGSIRLVSHDAGDFADTGPAGATLVAVQSGAVIFNSTNTNHVAGVTDTNNASDVFSYDIATGVITLVSHAAGANLTAANGASFAVQAPTTARVLIETTATNLVNGLSGAMTRDVVLWSRDTNAFALVSHASSGTTTRANAAAHVSALNTFGSRAVFETAATNVVAGFAAPLTNASNLYVYDLNSASNKLLTHVNGSPAIGSARAADPTSVKLDWQGDTIVLATLAGDLSPSLDGNATADVYAYDYPSNASSLVSRAAFALPAAGEKLTTPVGISADGRYVLESSNAINLAFDQIETDNDTDVFVYDADTGRQTLVSSSIEGIAVLSNVPANAPSTATAISRDGGWVLFQSAATNLIAFPNDTNAATDVFVAQSSGGAQLVSHSTAGTNVAGNGAATATAISSDGRWILYESNASNHVAGVTDTNATTDVFLFDRLNNTSVLVSHASGATGAANDKSHAIALSPDGRFVLYQSRATNLVAGFVNLNAAGDDAYLYDRTTATSRLVSHESGNGTRGASQAVAAVGLSDDGDRVVFYTSAGNLIGTGVTNGLNEAFVYRVSTDTTRLVSHTAQSETDLPGSTSVPIAISGDGTTVLFSTNSNQIVDGFVDNNGAANDVYWYDTTTRANTLFSHAAGSATQGSNREWVSVQVNRDASRVVFATLASDVINGINAGAFFQQVYQYDRATTSTSLVSHRDGAALEAIRNSTFPTMSDNGDRVAFDSDSQNLVAWTDLNDTRDTFLARRVNGYVVTAVVTGNGSINPSGAQSVAPGGTVAFTLTPGVGQRIASTGGCGGSLNGNVYTTAAVNADCTVTFGFSPQQFTLHYLADLHGSIGGNALQTVDYGGSGTEVQAQPAVGYDFDHWSDNRPGQGRTDANVTADLTVTAFFKIKKLNLLYTAGAGGTIDGQASRFFTVDYGADGPLITAVPDMGKVFVKWSDGVVTAQRTDRNVTANVTVDAQFADNAQLTVTPVVGLHGSVAPNAPQSVAPGGTAFFDVTPDLGYRIGSAAGCGGSLVGARFTTGPVAANCSVTFAFNRIPVAQNGTLDAVEDGGSYGGMLSANDDDAFTIIVVTQPTKGSLNVQASGQYFYSPNPDANGADSFSFKINDGVQDSNTATVSIQIAPVNDKPAFALNPAVLPEHPQGTSGPQTRAGILTAVDFGPPDEDATQSIASVQAFEFFDPSNVISAVSVSTAGVLTYTLTGNAGVAKVSVSITDSGGGNATSDPQTLTISVRNATDLRVSDTNGATSVAPGQAVVYEVLASNAGPYATTGALLDVPVPAGLGNVLWSCNAIQLATCPQANGAGAIAGLSMDLPSGGVLRFLVTGTVTAANGATLTHTAAIATSGAMAEANAADNSATDADPVAALGDPIFRDGYEAAGSGAPVAAHALLYPEPGD